MCAAIIGDDCMGIQSPKTPDMPPMKMTALFAPEMTNGDTENELTLKVSPAVFFNTLKLCIELQELEAGGAIKSD